MRKLLAIMLALVAVLTLSGCRGNDENTNSERGWDNPVPEERPIFIESEDSSDGGQDGEIGDSGSSDVALPSGIQIPDELPVIERVYLCTYKRYDNGELVHQSDYYYDKYFNIIKVYPYDIETGERKETDGEYSYIYDENGNVKVKFYGDTSSYDVYYYDENGLEIKKEYYSGGGLLNTRITDYNEQGDEIRSYSIYKWTTDEEIAAEQKKHSDHKYDEKGRNTYIASYDENDELNYELFFEYNDDDKLTLCQHHWYFTDKETVINFYYKYDGNIHTETEYSVDGNGKETLESIEICEYNEYERLSKLVRYDENGVETMRETYDYTKLAGVPEE